MKRKVAIVLSFALVFCMLFGINAFAFEEKGAVKLLKTEKVKLQKNDKNAKTYELKSKLDNGITIYDLGAVDEKDRQLAFEFLKKLTGDTTVKTIFDTNMGSPGNYYGNDLQMSNNAWSYTWEQFNLSNTGVGLLGLNIDSYGGQTGGWSGSGTPNFIILNQTATFNGVSFTISWPPSMTGSSTSRSWQSQPIYNSTNVAADHAPINSWCMGFTSVEYIDTADVYMGSQVYRPTSNVTFSGW